MSKRMIDRDPTGTLAVVARRWPNPATPDERTRAARCVASQARDVDECAELLDMLGLSADGGEAS